MTVTRTNPDLDSAFARDMSFAGKPKGRRKRVLTKETVFRYCIKVLGCINDFDRKDRERILRHAIKLNRG